MTRSKTFGIFSKTSIWNSLRGNIQDVESLPKTIRFIRVCEGASFVQRVSGGMSYKTKPDEDDGFEQISPLCREYTFSRINPRSRAFAAILGGTIIGPVIEVQIVKILDQYGLGIAISSPNDTERTSYVMISRGNFKNQKEESPAWHSQILACRRLVRPMLQVRLASRKLVRTLSAFLPARRPFSRIEPFLRTRGSGKLFSPILRMEELCQYRSPKWLQELCVITIKMMDNLTQRFIGTR